MWFLVSVNTYVLRCCLKVLGSVNTYVLGCCLKVLGSVNTYVMRCCLKVDVDVSECKYVCIEVLFEGVSVRECK